MERPPIEIMHVDTTTPLRSLLVMFSVICGVLTAASVATVIIGAIVVGKQIEDIQDRQAISLCAITEYHENALTRKACREARNAAE